MLKLSNRQKLRNGTSLGDTRRVRNRSYCLNALRNVPYEQHTADSVGETWNVFRFVTMNRCVLCKKEARFCCTLVQTLRVETAIWCSIRDGLPKKTYLDSRQGKEILFFLESFWTGSGHQPPLDSMRKGSTFPEGKVEGAEY